MSAPATDQDAAFGQFGDGHEEIVDTGKLSALRDADAATKPGGDFGEQRIRGLRTGGARIGEGTRVEPLRTQSSRTGGDLVTQVGVRAHLGHPLGCVQVPQAMGAHRETVRGQFAQPAPQPPSRARAAHRNRQQPDSVHPPSMAAASRTCGSGSSWLRCFSRAV